MPKAAGSTKTRVERGPDVFSRRLYTRLQRYGRCPRGFLGERGDGLLADHAVESGGRLAELQGNLADGSIAVLGDLGLDELHLALGVLLAVPIQEDHDVRVLLDGTRLAKVGEPRFSRASLLHAAGQLRDGDDRDLELPSQLLETAADLAHLLHAIR